VSEPICFPAQVVKIQTLVDGGIRITLDTGEGNILQAAQLMEVKRAQAYGDVEFTPRATVKQTENNGLGKGSERKSEWKTKEEAGTHPNS